MTYQDLLWAAAVFGFIVALDVVLCRSHWARHTFAKLAGKIPRWSLWLVFLFAIGTSSHLASVWAMAAFIVAITVFGFVMLAWQSASDAP